MSIVEHPEHPSLPEPSAQTPFTEQLAAWQGRNVSTLQPRDQKQLQEFCRTHIGEYTRLLSELEQKKVDEVTAQDVGAFYETWSQVHQFKSCLERSNCVAYTKKGFGIVGAFFATWSKLGFKKACQASYLHVANKDVVETRRGDVEKAVKRVFVPMGYNISASTSQDMSFSLSGYEQALSFNPSQARDVFERAISTFRAADTQRKQQEVQRILVSLSAPENTPLNSEEFTRIVPSEERTRVFVFYQPASAGALFVFGAKKEGLLVQNPGGDSTREISFDSEEWHNMPPDEQLALLSAVGQTKETHAKYNAIKTIRESGIGRTTEDAIVVSTLQDKVQDPQFQNTYCLHSVAGEPYKRTLYLIKNNQLHTYNVDFSSGKIKAAVTGGENVEGDSFENLIEKLVGRGVAYSSFSSKQGIEVRQVQDIKNSLLRQLNGVDERRYQTARDTCCRQIGQIHQYNSEKYSSSVNAFQLIQKPNGDLDLKTFQIKPDGQVSDEQSKPVVVNPDGQITYGGRLYRSVQDLQPVLQQSMQPLDAVEKQVKKDFEEAQAATITSLRDVVDLHVQDHDNSEVGQTFSQLQSLSTKRVLDPQDIHVPVFAVHINKKRAAGATGWLARIATLGYFGSGDDSLVISIIKRKPNGRGYELIQQAITCPAPGKYRVGEQEFTSLEAIKSWIAQQGKPIYPDVANLLQTVQGKHDALGFSQLPSAQDVERDRARCKKFFGKAALQQVWVLGKAKDAPRGSEEVCLYQGAQPGQLVHIHPPGYTVGDGAGPSDALPAGQGCTLKAVTDVVDEKERRMSRFESASCQVSGQTYPYFSSKIPYRVGQEQSVIAQMDQVVQLTQHDCQLIVKDPTQEPPVYLFLEGEYKDGSVSISSAQVHFKATIEGDVPRITEQVEFHNVPSTKQQGYIGLFLRPSVDALDTYEHLLQTVAPAARKAPKMGGIVSVENSEYEGVSSLQDIENTDDKIQQVLHPEVGAATPSQFYLAQLCLAEIEEKDQISFSGLLGGGPSLADCEFKQLLSKISSDEELEEPQKLQMEKAIREKSKQSNLTKIQVKALIHLIFALGLRPGCLSPQIVSRHTSDINEIEKLYTEVEEE